MYGLPLAVVRLLCCIWSAGDSTLVGGSIPWSVSCCASFRSCASPHTCVLGMLSALGMARLACVIVRACVTSAVDLI